MPPSVSLHRMRSKINHRQSSRRITANYGFAIDPMISNYRTARTCRRTDDLWSVERSERPEGILHQLTSTLSTALSSVHCSAVHLLPTASDDSEDNRAVRRVRSASRPPPVSHHTVRICWSAASITYIFPRCNRSQDFPRISAKLITSLLGIQVSAISIWIVE